MRGPRLIVVAVAAALATSCATRRVALPQDASATVCRTIEGARDAGVERPLDWHELTDEHDRLAMAASCLLVGPAVYWPAPAARGQPAPRAAALAVVSWNIHVGGGDLGALIDALRGGRFTYGRPVEAFVILVLEAFRRGAAVPALRRDGAAIPRRISPSPPAGLRQDIVEIARTRGLNVFYLPSMRNGSGEGAAAEDRGNAILSTFPLTDLTGIELPFERQRRVAAVATVTGRDTAGTLWRLRVVSAHLNATANIRRLWVFAARSRLRQARHLALALDTSPVPTVVGIDLNTWAGGWSEPAFGTLRSHFPQTRDPSDAAGFGQRRMLDYVFLRMPPAWFSSLTAIEDHFGSDHRPVIAWIELNGGASQAPARRGVLLSRTS